MILWLRIERLRLRVERLRLRLRVERLRLRIKLSMIEVTAGKLRVRRKLRIKLLRKRGRRESSSIKMMLPSNLIRQHRDNHNLKANDSINISKSPLNLSISENLSRFFSSSHRPQLYFQNDEHDEQRFLLVLLWEFPHTRVTRRKIVRQHARKTPDQLEMRTMTKLELRIIDLRNNYA